MDKNTKKIIQTELTSMQESLSRVQESLYRTDKLNNMHFEEALNENLLSSYGVIAASNKYKAVLIDTRKYVASPQLPFILRVNAEYIFYFEKDRILEVFKNRRTHKLSTILNVWGLEIQNIIDIDYNMHIKLKINPGLMYLKLKGKLL